MEFCSLGFDGLVMSSSNGFTSHSSDQNAKQKWLGSDNDGLRASKMAKLGDDLSVSKPQSFLFSDVSGLQEHNMLSFSKDNGGLDRKSLQSPAFGSYVKHPSASYSKSSGYSCSGGGVNTSMYILNGVKGPFTPTQWVELEQQAMIYKYIIANEPIPPHLLFPIRGAFESAVFSSFPGGLLRPNSFGWSPFHLGVPSSTDPEPGRCRRTDGKKWRCSRDAVPDQKYCERHINRGRHRSRKPVEGTQKQAQQFHPTASQLSTSPSSTSLVGPGGGSSNSFSAISLNNDSQNNKALQQVQPVSRLDFLSPSISLNSSANGSTFSIAKEQNDPCKESAAGGFFLNPTSEKTPIYRPYPSAHDLNTEPADFMSSTSSPTGEKNFLSPLRHAGDNRHANWVPISWESSVGGPLGEVLKSTSNNSSEEQCRNVSSALNLLSKGWEGRSNSSTSSPHLASSPTDVLQRTALTSLSTSSAGSSPRAADIGVDLIGSALAN